MYNNNTPPGDLWEKMLSDVVSGHRGVTLYGPRSLRTDDDDRNVFIWEYETSHL